jgi:hypothetical protein
MNPGSTYGLPKVVRLGRRIQWFGMPFIGGGCYGMQTYSRERLLWIPRGKGADSLTRYS